MKNLTAYLVIATLLVPGLALACMVEAASEFQSTKCKIKIPYQVIDSTNFTEQLQSRLFQCQLTALDFEQIAPLVKEKLNVRDYNEIAFQELRNREHEQSKCGPTSLKRSGNWIGYRFPNGRWTGGACEVPKCHNYSHTDSRPRREPVLLAVNQQ